MKALGRWSVFIHAGLILVILSSCMGQKPTGQEGAAILPSGSGESYGGGGSPTERLEAAHEILRSHNAQILSSDLQDLCIPCASDNGSFYCRLLANPDPKLKQAAIALITSQAEKFQQHLDESLSWDSSSRLKVLDTPLEHRGQSVTARVVPDSKGGMQIEFNGPKVLSYRLDDLAMIYYHELGHFFGAVESDEKVFSGERGNFLGSDLLNMAGACVAQYEPPTCELTILESNYDRVRVEVESTGKLKTVIFNGQSYPAPAAGEALTWVPDRIGEILSEAVVVGENGQRGFCQVSHVVDDPVQQVTILSSSAPTHYFNPPQSSDLAFDGDINTAWNYGDFGDLNANMTIDLGRSLKLSQVRIFIGMTPSGRTVHSLHGKATSSGSWSKMGEIDRVTHDREWVEFNVSSPAKVRYLQLRNPVTPSWVLWFEVEIFECTSERACN